ncbi:MAG: DHA2 family efflux MFS transporter permease subunit [Candidatus Margulisiibacteriota bacterium]
MSETGTMSRKSIIIIITAVMAALLEILDASIVNVSIPTMMGNLGVTLDDISWVSTGYMIANSIILPIAAWFGTRLGRRNYFTGAILLFTLASFMCGISPNLLVLVFFRILQGLSGGALLPTAQTLIQEQFPKEKVTLAMAIFGMSIMIGPALGPVLGGYLTDNFGWRAIFNVNIPIGIVAAICSYVYIDQVQPDPGASKKSVDWIGFALLFSGVGCFQFILERGQAEGWFDATSIRVCLVCALVSLISFIVWELKVKNPIMNLRLFKTNAVNAGSLLMMALGVILYTLTFVVPILSDKVMHLTATQTGLLFIPGSVATAMTMMVVSRIAKHVHPRAIILAGITIAASSVLLMTGFSTSTGAQALFLPLILRGIGAGCLFLPILSTVTSQFRGEELAQVNGLMNFFRQIGGSIGIASLSLLLTRFSKQNYEDLRGNVSLLSPSGYHDFVSLSKATIPHAMTQNIGFGSPTTFATKALYGRVMEQTFMMSFNQLSWCVIILVVLMVIPVFAMKMQRRLDAKVDAH